jgi:dihydrodipicolinate reductase
LASEAIDDVPDREILKNLLARLEAEASGGNRVGNKSNSTIGIGEARGGLLQAARRAADRSRKRLADVIADASQGKLLLEGLKNLTEADVALVVATTARIEGGGGA